MSCFPVHVIWKGSLSDAYALFVGYSHPICHLFSQHHISGDLTVLATLLISTRHMPFLHYLMHHFWQWEFRSYTYLYVPYFYFYLSYFSVTLMGKWSNSKALNVWSVILYSLHSINMGLGRVSISIYHSLCIAIATCQVTKGNSPFIDKNGLHSNS